MKGIGVSPGISIGKAFLLQKKKAALTCILLTTPEEIAAAVEQFDDAITNSVNEIEAIKSNTLSDEDLAILETQIELLSDPEIRDGVVEKIEIEYKNPNDALLEVVDVFVQLFENMDDEYMRARAVDIRDIGNRILKNLNGQTSGNQVFEPDTIIIAEDLSPSDTITMDVSRVTGFATQMGSKTSHAAIIAKSKGIPAVVGCGADLISIKNNDVIILDGSQGLVLINPGQELIDEYTAKRNAYRQHAETLKALRDEPAVTTDGMQVMLSANISGAEDLEDVFDNGGESVGLLRTELLFMNRDNFPTEDEQFEFYKKAALQAKGKPVIVRTIDIGGDKQLPYFNLPAELNPFLGYRAIRICLDRKDLFITQLKAILRASVFGDLKIMFPMISNIQEIRSAKSILGEAKAELLSESISFNPAMKVGIMIEIPSAAITADLLAKEVDFFSIGTNDLCQYTLAVDRMNEQITHLYDPFNPGVLRLISFVIEQGEKHGIHVGMCGEMASDPLATLLLLGMGLKEFSMSAASIPAIKSIIINNSELKAKQIYKNVMEMDSSEDILGYLKGITADE
ncbi:phosphoenolpyruvate--protein phosphotransferase [Mucilaginibacter sp. BJC16-A38]|uniref:phosphoenolpyruvate--protein phosphotransferase n=1 Tax=Mucilaginibacter phenanthrenivorans TaxID=1234842 RepID=UPI00215862E9|nr:phosphoenolpyruvate--protein phosphotransferase [Mucilaginibacter phenanthrenivorans]MCR8558931.1 phosphoenolpyruvate--protein phosphotransferase [Mucilaginibacter phenanthrenivorans]